MWERDEVGQEGDYQLTDENGRLVWASELAKRYWTETYPRAILRSDQLSKWIPSKG